MTTVQMLLTIGAVVLGTMTTRFLPFLIFPGSMLVVYCLRNVDVLHFAYGLPELIAIAVTIVLHLWKKQMLLSIACGTVCYMLLVQLVF